MRILLSHLILVVAAVAAPDGWHANLKDGLHAAKKSGKPLFVATMWKKGT
jgi:hypothetical protein